jgi:hypothetical protein
VTLNPSLSPITGPATVLVGATITLSDAAFGGKWKSYLPFMADTQKSQGKI